jgi:hypothetical protein
MLLPAVQIPLVAWCLIFLLWVCGKSIQEAGRSRPTKEPEQKPKIFIRNDWITSTEYDLVYSTPDREWQLVGTRDGESAVYVLFSGDQESSVYLSASTLSEAMDQADMIIDALARR